MTTLTDALAMFEQQHGARPTLVQFHLHTHPPVSCTVLFADDAGHIIAGQYDRLEAEVFSKWLHTMGYEYQSQTVYSDGRILAMTTPEGRIDHVHPLGVIIPKADDEAAL